MDWRSWREQLELGMAEHRAHGKRVRNEPETEDDWARLYHRYPNSPLRALWFVLTGRAV